MRVWRIFLNALLPPRCIRCGLILSQNNGLCADCFKQINFISEPLCKCCGRPFDGEKDVPFGRELFCAECMKKKRHLLSIQRSAFIYDDASKKMILDFKFNDKTSSAEALAVMLFSAGRDIWNESPDLLIPVPLHKMRLLSRRYNQSALLVKYLSEKVNIKADYFSLVRQQNTIPQVQLSGEARRHNLRHAFVVQHPENVSKKKIVLIDDVSTTGSTLSECAKVLKAAGAEKIYSLTLARTKD